MEHWKSILGYEGIYEVSDQGRVRSARKKQRTFVGKIMKLRLDSDGYSILMLNKIGSPKSLKKVHRLVAEGFIPNPDNLPEVNHKNGIKIYNVVENLEWSTHADNQKHAGQTNLMAKGSRNGIAKLTKEAVVSIRKSVLSGIALANEYKVSTTTISLIKNRKIWKHL